MLEAFHDAEGRGGGGDRTVHDALSGLPPLRRGHKSRRDPSYFAVSHGESVAKVIRNVPKDG